MSAAATVPWRESSSTRRSREWRRMRRPSSRSLSCLPVLAVSTACVIAGAHEGLQEHLRGRAGAHETVLHPLSLSLMAEAEAAIKALDGRWFGGKMIKAQIYDQAKFEANELSQ